MFGYWWAIILLSSQPQLLRHLYFETEVEILEKAYTGRRGQVVTLLTIV